MLDRIQNSYSDPDKARLYKFVALFLATAAFVFIGVGNALDAPEPGSVYEKENALGMVLVIGQTLPLAIAFRFPVIALTVAMVSFQRFR